MRSRRQAALGCALVVLIGGCGQSQAGFLEQLPFQLMAPPRNGTAEVKTHVVKVKEFEPNGLLPGKTTFRLVIELTGQAQNVYTIYGDKLSPMEIPSAFTVPPPFGHNVGGNNPAFYPMKPECQYDSWLTVGPTEGSESDISSIGINDFATWNTTGLHVDDGAVFWMDPNAAPGGKVTVAQLTVPTGASWLVSLNAQGRSRQPSDSDDRVPDWAATALFFQHNGTGPIGDPCQEALQATCTAPTSQSGVSQCLDCAGNAALELQKAGCTADRVRNYCKPPHFTTSV